MYGAERSLLTTAIGLMQRRERIVVLLPGHGPLEHELAENGIPYIVWRYYGWLGRRHRWLKGAYRLVYNVLSALTLSFVKKPEFHLVYTNTITTNFGVMLSVLNRCPHIWHVREFVHEDMNAEFDFGKGFARRVALTKLQFAIYNSHSVRDKFLGYLGSHKSTVIWNGVKPPLPHQRHRVRQLSMSSDVNLCMVSSLHRGKGHGNAIDALPFIIETYRNCRLHIVGDGDDVYLQQLKRRAHQLGVSDHIVWHGYLSDPRELIYQSDIFLMCSTMEAFGRVTVEALSVGCPVVGARSGGTTEIIEDQITGLLYRPNDARDLAEKVVFLLNDFMTRKALSQNALDKYEKNFTEDRYVESLITRLAS